MKRRRENGIANNTMVFYSTNNGPRMNARLDAGWNAFRSEKNTNWEGGWRVRVQAYVVQFLTTFNESLLGQKVVSFSMDKAMELVHTHCGALGGLCFFGIAARLG